MFSPFYCYFEIRFDRQYSRTIAAQTVRSLLARFAELTVTEDGEFKAAEGVPWLSLSLQKPPRSHTSQSRRRRHPEVREMDQEDPESIGYVWLVGSKGEAGDETERAFYVDLATRIARLLRWEAVEEDDEEPDGYIVLWRPE